MKLFGSDFSIASWSHLKTENILACFSFVSYRHSETFGGKENYVGWSSNIWLS